MPRYYVEGNHLASIKIADNAAQAERMMREDLGTYGGPYKARLATEADLADIRAMGGDTKEPRK